MDKEAFHLHSILNDTQISIPSVNTPITVAATSSSSPSAFSTGTSVGRSSGSVADHQHLSDVLGDRILMERLTVLRPSQSQLNFRQSGRNRHKDDEEEDEEEGDDPLPESVANPTPVRSTPTFLSSSSPPSSSRPSIISRSFNDDLSDQSRIALKMIESVKRELSQRTLPSSSVLHMKRPLQAQEGGGRALNMYSNEFKSRLTWTPVESDDDKETSAVLNDGEDDGEDLDDDISDNVGSAARFNISLFTMDELNRTLADIDWLQSQRPVSSSSSSSLGYAFIGLSGGKGRNNRNRIAQKMEYLERLYRMNQKPHTKRGEGPQLSVVSPLDVLRQKLLLEMTRRKLKESMNQVEENAELLKNLGKRSLPDYLDWNESKLEDKFRWLTQPLHRQLSSSSSSLSLPVYRRQ